MAVLLRTVVPPAPMAILRTLPRSGAAGPWLLVGLVGAIAATPVPVVASRRPLGLPLSLPFRTTPDPQKKLGAKEGEEGGGLIS